MLVSKMKHAHEENGQYPLKTNEIKDRHYVIVSKTEQDQSDPIASITAQHSW